MTHSILPRARGVCSVMMKNPRPGEVKELPCQDRASACAGLSASGGLAAGLRTLTLLKEGCRGMCRVLVWLLKKNKNTQLLPKVSSEKAGMFPSGTSRRISDDSAAPGPAEIVGQEGGCWWGAIAELPFLLSGPEAGGWRAERGGWDQRRESWCLGPLTGGGGGPTIQFLCSRTPRGGCGERGLGCSLRS